jgi:uncharacterized membrane protein YeaQ/YmgE (transglycosylase-associated protein family)
MDAQRLAVMAVIGLFGGFLASFIVGGVRGGLIGCLIAGMIGSVVGGWILSQMGRTISVGNALADNVITSTIGAILVILVARLLL